MADLYVTNFQDEDMGSFGVSGWTVYSGARCKFPYIFCCTCRNVDNFLDVGVGGGAECNWLDCACTYNMHS